MTAQTLKRVVFGKRSGSGQIAWATNLGLLIGFTPTFVCLQTWLAILALPFLRLPLRYLLLVIGASYLLGALVFDYLFNAIGQAVLGAEALQGLWTSLYNMPIVPLTHFNNSVVLGATLFTLALFPLSFVVIKKLNQGKAAAQEGAAGAA